MKRVIDFSAAATRSSGSFWTNGRDIRILGIFFIISGFIDLVWILSFPDYALKVFGTTLSGWGGALVKYQHPVIHWAIGYGFWNRQRWSFWAYLVYLAIACASEISTQMVQGYHQTRTTMIVISLLFASYIVFRKNAFDSSHA